MYVCMYMISQWPECKPVALEEKVWWAARHATTKVKYVMVTLLNGQNPFSCKLGKPLTIHFYQKNQLLNFGLCIATGVNNESQFKEKLA